MTVYDDIQTGDDGSVTYEEYNAVVPWYDGISIDVRLHTADWLAAIKSMDAAAAASEAANAIIAANEAAIDELLLLIGGA